MNSETIKIYNVVIALIILVLAIVAILIYFLKNRNVSPLDMMNYPDTLNQKQEDYTTAFNNNDFEMANSIADRKIESNNKDAEAYTLKANALAQQASLEFKEKELGDQALFYINKALELEPNSAEALTIKGYIYEIQENYNEAYNNYQIAIEKDPSYAYAYARYGHAKQLQSKINEALAYYEKSLGLDGNNTLALYGTAKIWATNNRPEDALNILLKLVTLPTDNRLKAEAYYSASAIVEYLNQKDLNQIQQLAEKGIQADPTFANNYVILARTNYKRIFNATSKDEKRKLAEESYTQINKAIQLNKNLSIAHLQLAEQLYADNRIKDSSLVLKSLPDIIKNDITLSSQEKSTLLNQVNKLITKVK